MAARKPTPQQIAPPEAFGLTFADKADVEAVQALARGDANEGQQVRALRWIVDHAARTYDQPFRPGHDGQTEFACGRQFVGQEIVRVLRIPVGQMMESENGRSSGSGEQPGQG